MKKELFTLLGFILFCTGVLAIILSIVGIDFAFLVWLNSLGSLTAFLVKLMMIIGGVLVVVLGRTDWELEERGE